MGDFQNKNLGAAPGFLIENGDRIEWHIFNFFGKTAGETFIRSRSHAVPTLHLDFPTIDRVSRL